MLKQIDNILKINDILIYQDNEKLLKKAMQLKQTDGEGWAIGEIIQILISD